ncbi:MAG: uL15 family ribosomal protein [Candidatus Paceibacterota bacterium]|jgi:large subunit ribosomal protein L15
MQTHQLKRNHPNMKRMIVARGGHRGKTAGRGGKGQSARAGNKRRPEWRDIIKRLPKLRGRGVNQNKSFAIANTVIKLTILDKSFDAKESVSPSILIAKGIIRTKSGVIPTVKILGDGEITKALMISGCLVSQSAKEKIEKVGGIITPVPSRVVVKVPAVKVVKEKVEKAPNAEKTEKITKVEKTTKVTEPATKETKSRTKTAESTESAEPAKKAKNVAKVDKKVKK